MDPIIEKALRFTQIQESNRRHYDQVKAAQKESARYEKVIRARRKREQVDTEATILGVGRQ